MDEQSLGKRVRKQPERFDRDSRYVPKTSVDYRAQARPSSVLREERERSVEVLNTQVLPTETKLEHADVRLRGGLAAPVVRSSPSGLVIEAERLRELEAWMQAKLEMREGKSHIQVPLLAVPDAPGLGVAEPLVSWWQEKLAGTKWMCMDAVVVYRKGDGTPIHRDRKTGFTSYDREGYRMLFDLTGNRTMDWRVNLDGPVLFSTQAPLVAMNAAAAGHDFKSNVYHARWGDGLSLSIDVALNTHGTMADRPTFNKLRQMLLGTKPARKLLPKAESQGPQGKAFPLGTKCDRCPAVKTKTAKNSYGNFSRFGNDGPVLCPSCYLKAWKQAQKERLAAEDDGDDEEDDEGEGGDEGEGEGGE